MTETGKRAEHATITELGIHNSTVYWNLTSKELADISLKKGEATQTSTGAININTGEFTGRSPMDRFIVKDKLTKNSVWWGDINLSFDQKKFDKLHKKILNYLSNKEIYVRPSYIAKSAISLLEFEPILQKHLRLVDGHLIEDLLDIISDLNKLMLLIKLMSVCPLPDLELEKLLTNLRSSILANISSIKKASRELIEFQSAKLHIVHQVWIVS